MVLAILIAVSLTILNLIFSIVIVNYAMKTDWNRLYKLVFGSIVAKYFVTAFLVWICLKYLDLDKFAFAITFLISTFIMIFVEILFIHYRAKSLKLNKMN
jgi:hypothetical protein